jgi:hypothetical protein
MWPKDEQRIAEERAGVARPAPATLASSHLAQALDSFDDACCPEAVFAPRKIWPLQPIRSHRTTSMSSAGLARPVTQQINARRGRRERVRVGDAGSYSRSAVGADYSRGA